MVIDTNWQAD